MLNLIDFVGNNGWSRNGQTEALTPTWPGDCGAVGLDIDGLALEGRDGEDGVRTPAGALASRGFLNRA